MESHKTTKRPYFFRVSIFICLILLMGIVALDSHFYRESRPYIYESPADAPPTFVALVLGAGLRKGGVPSPVLKDRLETAFMLYHLGKVKRLLLSGDHSTKSHDEVKAMKDYLVTKGVPEQDIFLDHAGLDTYDSLYRAKAIFQIEELVVVTQAFHLPRAVYIGNKLGIKTMGVVADQRVYETAWFMSLREKLANLKAFGELFIHKQPSHLGDKIPII